MEMFQVLLVLELAYTTELSSLGRLMVCLECRLVCEEVRRGVLSDLLVVEEVPVLPEVVLLLQGPLLLPPRTTSQQNLGLCAE
jgi:hypothetical protein